MDASEVDLLPEQSVFVVALTGGIASGKTAVTGLFAKLGVAIIDTDIIARELLEPEQPLLASIIAALGHELLDAYGQLKRRKLRELIFANKEKRELLNSLMHPEIAAEARRQINNVKSGYCILVIPLLIEKGGYAGVDRVLVVDASPEVQIARLTARDDVSPAQAEAAIASQAERAERRSVADDLIDNSGPEALLEDRVLALHQLYLTLCGPDSERKSKKGSGTSKFREMGS